jgi:hypothetical protein
MVPSSSAISVTQTLSHLCHQRFHVYWIRQGAIFPVADRFIIERSWRWKGKNRKNKSFYGYVGGFHTHKWGKALPPLCVQPSCRDLPASWRYRNVICGSYEPYSLCLGKCLWAGIFWMSPGGAWLLTLLGLRAVSKFALGKHCECNVFHKCFYMLRLLFCNGRQSQPPLLEANFGSSFFQENTYLKFLAASEGRGHTKNIWSNFRPPSVKETSCRLLCPWLLLSLRRVLEEPRTSMRDTPGWSIDTFEPMSKIRRLALLSISSATEGATCSNKSELMGLPTAFSGMLRWSELSPLSPPIRFLNILFPWSW